MKITTSHYLSGMPANESYSIQLSDGITLDLSPDQFKQLSACIGEKHLADTVRIQEVSDKFFEKYRKKEEIFTDLRKIFYHGDEDGDFFFRTELKDIDANRLYEILEKHANVLGLE